MVAHLNSAGMKLDEREFLVEFQERLNRYYRERESEFIEYTTEYVLRKLLEERGTTEPSDNVIRSALRVMYAVSQAHWHPEPDAIPTLEYLSKEGYRLGLISNASDDDDVQTLVDKANLRPYFEVILSSAAAGIRKPDPRIFHLALDEMGVPAERAGMVGDTLGADILGANNAGIFSIWITRRADVPANRDHLDTIQPDATIAELRELPGLLESLGGRSAAG